VPHRRRWASGVRPPPVIDDRWASGLAAPSELVSSGTRSTEEIRPRNASLEQHSVRILPIVFSSLMPHRAARLEHKGLPNAL
jgi:hypothetical protein